MSTRARALRLAVAAGTGLAVWVLGGSVSALNVLTPRARVDPPEVGLALISEVFYWSHPAWAIAAVAFAMAVYLGSEPRVRQAGSPVLLPTLIAVATYALAGGLAEAILVNGPDTQGRSFIDEVGGAIGTSLAVGLNGVFAASVALAAFWQLGRVTPRRPDPGASGGGKGVRPSTRSGPTVPCAGAVDEILPR